MRAAVAGNQLCAFRSSGSMRGMLDVADYELVWPPELFAAEARRIVARQRVSAQAIDLLLREAFRDDSAAEDVAAPVPFDSWSSGAVARSASDMLAELAKSAHVIRRFSAPRPYWPQRRAGKCLARTWMPPGSAAASQVSSRSLSARAT